MKYFFILLILVFSHNSIAEEKKLEHFCKMNTKFYETDKNEWSQKMINYDFYVLNNNEIKVLDKETKRYLYSFKIILNNNRVLVGYFSDHKMINIFTFNKITKYAKYSNTYFDEQGGGQIVLENAILKLFKKLFTRF